MPKTKDAFTRYRLIDSLLRRKSYVKTSEIVDRLYDKYEIGIGQTTINKDIRDMQSSQGLGFYAPIKYSHSEKAYYYPDNVDEIIPAIELHQDELSALKFYTNILSHYKEFGLFKNFTSAIEKVVDAVKIQSTQKDVKSRILVVPENHPKFMGSELLPEIISGFDQSCKFQFEYEKHTKEPAKTHTVSPILLKEYDHLWYLAAKIDSRNFITIFALDRIRNFRVTNTPKDDTSDFNKDEYFQYTFGIAVPKEREVEQIVLEFDLWRGQYLKAAPIHHTQEVIAETDDKIRFSFKLIPFHELHNKILSYGSSVEVISPQSMRLEIKSILENTLKNY